MSLTLQSSILPKSLVALALSAAALGQPGIARADYSAYVGEVIFTAASYCPSGWLHADGRLVAVRDAEILFYVIGTRYGGDGKASFGLPDLRTEIVDGGDDGSVGLRPCIPAIGYYPVPQE